MQTRRRVPALLAFLLALGFLSVPASATPTSGSGGALTNRLNQSFTSAGLTSRYHIFASGLDWTKTVGLLMYNDGSGGYGFDNPNSTYLLDADGSSGLVRVAKDHNLILVTATAPPPNCDGADNCWYNTSSSPNATVKARWSSDLMTYVKGQYPIELDRVVVGGYSSGAQWTTRWFMPNHGEAQSVDLAVAIAYGGAPYSSTSFSSGYKASTVLSWDTGKSDSAYTSASYGAIGGYNWYTKAGFTTDATWPSGVGHSRSGQFDTIMDRELDQWLDPATARSN